jgi:hypothetical protein
VLGYREGVLRLRGDTRGGGSKGWLAVYKGGRGRKRKRGEKRGKMLGGGVPGGTKRDTGKRDR